MSPLSGNLESSIKKFGLIPPAIPSAGNLISANLDIKNPNNKQDFVHMPPEQLMEDILKKEQRIIEIIAEIKQVLAQEPKA